MFACLLSLSPLRAPRLAMHAFRCRVRFPLRCAACCCDKSTACALVSRLRWGCVGSGHTGQDRLRVQGVAVAEADAAGVRSRDRQRDVSNHKPLAQQTCAQAPHSQSQHDFTRAPHRMDSAATESRVARNMHLRRSSTNEHGQAESREAERRTTSGPTVVLASQLTWSKKHLDQLAARCVSVCASSWCW